MKLRKIFPWLDNHKKEDTQSTDPAVSRRPQAQLAISSSEHTPKALRKPKFDGEWSGWTTQLQSVLTVLLWRDRRGHVSDPICFRPLPSRSQCRWQQTRGNFEPYRRLH